MEEQEEIYVDNVMACTDAALLLDVDGQEVWLPRSICDDAAAWEVGSFGAISVPTWWAKKVGLAE